MQRELITIEQMAVFEGMIPHEVGCDHAAQAVPDNTQRRVPVFVALIGTGLAQRLRAFLDFGMNRLINLVVRIALVGGNIAQQPDHIAAHCP